MKDWKERLNIVFSTKPDFEYETAEEEPIPTLPPAKQLLRVELDKRNGKPATLITGYQGSEQDLKELAKTLKIKCGSGGSARGGEMLIQGDFRAKTAELLEGMGYKVKRINFS